MSFRTKLLLVLAAGALTILLAAAWALVLVTALIVVVLWIAGYEETGWDWIAFAVPLVLGGMLAAAYFRFGLKRGAHVAGDPALEKRLLRRLLLLPALGFALLALQWALFEERDARHAKSSAREQQRDDTLARLVEERFAPEHLQVESMADGAFRATARLTGVRRGRYRLNWGVRDGRRNEVLISDSEVLTLDAPRAFEVTFSQDDLARAYRDKLLGGHGGTASVEENFIFELSLLAVLSDAQMEQLPRYYIATSSEEKLAATAKTEVPVSFHVPE